MICSGLRVPPHRLSCAQGWAPGGTQWGSLLPCYQNGCGCDDGQASHTPGTHFSVTQLDLAWAVSPLAGEKRLLALVSAGQRCPLVASRRARMRFPVAAASLSVHLPSSWEPGRRERVFGGRGGGMLWPQPAQ